MKLNRNISRLAAALAVVLMISSSASAVLVSQLGVLDLSANGGINPATGNPWQAGDTYRLAFVTSATRNATSTDINDYNSFVQGVANGSSLGLSGATWKVIGSTQTVDARTNTGTTPPGGEATFLMDGTTVFATNYTDLWNGTAFVGSFINTSTQATVNLHLAPHFNEEGISVNGIAANGIPTGVQVFVGSNTNGTNDAVPGTRWFGFNGNVETGLTNPNNQNRWLEQFNTAATNSRSFYALSDPLTIRESAAATIPEPATASLALLGLGGLMMRRRRAAV